MWSKVHGIVCVCPTRCGHSRTRLAAFLGNVYDKEHNHTESLKWFRESLKHNPEYLIAHLVSALALAPKTPKAHSECVEMRLLWLSTPLRVDAAV